MQSFENENCVGENLNKKGNKKLEDRIESVILMIPIYGEF